MQFSPQQSISQVRSRAYLYQNCLKCLLKCRFLGRTADILRATLGNLYFYQACQVIFMHIKTSESLSCFFYSISWSSPTVKTSTSLPLNQPLPSTSLGITAQSCLNSLSLPLTQAPGLPALSWLWGHSTPPLNSFHLLLPHISPGLSGLAHSWACGG